MRAPARLCYVFSMTGETHVLESPPTGAAADWTIPQDWAHYTQADHRTWDTLFARHARMMPGRASDAYLRGLDALTLSKPGIPDLEGLRSEEVRGGTKRVRKVEHR